MRSISGRAPIAALEPIFVKLAQIDGVDSGFLEGLGRSLVRSDIYLPEQPLFRRPETNSVVRVIVNGWAARTRVTPDGRRQIFNFLLPGDIVVGRSRSSGGGADTVTALTLVETVELGALCGALDGHAAARSALSHACERASAREDELLLDHIVRLGQQNAMERMAHLFLELRSRLKEVGMATGGSYGLPLKQEHLGEALGMTLVHVNRTLQKLRGEGLIEYRNGKVTLLSPGRLARLAQYEVEPANRAPSALVA